MTLIQHLKETLWQNKYWIVFCCILIFLVTHVTYNKTRLEVINNCLFEVGLEPKVCASIIQYYK